MLAAALYLREGYWSYHVTLPESEEDSFQKCWTIPSHNTQVLQSTKDECV